MFLRRWCVVCASLAVWSVVMSGRGQTGGHPTIPKCALVNAEVVEGVMKLHGPPVAGPNGGCTFIANDYEQHYDKDPDEKSSISLSGPVLKQLFGDEAVYSPAIITKIEQLYRVKCETPFPMEQTQALWCFGKSRFSRNNWNYYLFVVSRDMQGAVSLGDWYLGPPETKPAAVLLAEVAFIHRTVPPEVLQWNAQWAHSPRGLKPGLWQLNEMSSGEGYSTPLTGPAVLFSCIRDRGASLRRLIPASISGCDTRVKQVSPSQEDVVIYCDGPKDEVPGRWDQSDTYSLTLNFENTEHYSIKETQEKFEIVDSKVGMATYKRRQQIGSRNNAIVARWLQDKCTVETEEPVIAPLAGR